jgi:hypothetical protein
VLSLHYADVAAKPVGTMKQLLEIYSLKEIITELKAKQECQSLIRVINRMLKKFKTNIEID